MQKNGLLTAVVTILTISFIILGIAIITALDRTKDRVEDSLEKVGELNTKIDNLNRNFIKLKTAQVANNNIAQVANNNIAQVANNNIAQVANNNIAQVANNNIAQVANVEFYDKNAKFNGELRTAIMSETKNLNYIVNNESLAGNLWDYCNDSLFTRNYEKLDKFEPLLAKSWSISEDKLTYTIYLRENVLWHDYVDTISKKEYKNIPVTAYDFKFFLNVIKNQDVNCAPTRGYFKDLEKIEVLSDYVFTVHWKKPYFLSKSMTLSLSPLPKHFYYDYTGKFDGKKFNDNHIKNRQLIGCGPYRFDKWEKGKGIILTRWEKYYGNDLGIASPLKTIHFEVIKHPNTRLLAIKGEKLDRVELTPDQWVNNTNDEYFAPKNGHLKKFKYSSRSYSYIGYNMKIDKFKDKRTRRALTHLIDRKRILKDVYMNLGRITTGPFFIDTPYYDKTIKPFEFSISKAKKILSEVGWADTDGDGILDKNGAKFQFRILQVTSHPLQSKILPIIKEDMAKVGIVMNIQKVEWSIYVQKLEKKEFEVCILGWGLSIESDPFQLWHSSHADNDDSSNHCSFKNKDADDLIDELRITFDKKRQIEIYHAFHKLIHDEQPYTFLINSYSLMGQSKKCKNAKVFSGGIPVKIMWKE